MSKDYVSLAYASGWDGFFASRQIHVCQQPAMRLVDRAWLIGGGMVGVLRSVELTPKF
jgi:hypothetical protein